MRRKILISLLTCLAALSLQAEVTKVLRFVSVAGEESQVAQKRLQKIVFTRDSVVLVSAFNRDAAAVYKYDYRSIIFDEADLPSAIEPASVQQPQTVKFIRNGQLYIRRDEQVYNILGNKIQ